MKSTLVKMLRRTSKGFAVAAEKLEKSTAVKDRQTWVKKTSGNAQLWAKRQMANMSTWFSVSADRFEKSSGSEFTVDAAKQLWSWISRHAGSIAAGSLAILFGLYAVMFLISMCVNGFIGVPRQSFAGTMQ